MNPKTKKAEETRERLLKAAAERFAAHGYRATRVQDICLEADANQAAVSYHFGGKYELYLSALKYALSLANETFPLPDDSDKDGETRLQAHLDVFLRRIFDEGDGSLFPRMMVKEMAEPTDALDAILRELIAPERDRLIAITREMLGPRASDDDVMLGHLSVVALFQFFNFSRAIRQLVERKKIRTHPDVMRTVEHTVHFAIAGLRAKRKEIEERA